MGGEEDEAGDPGPRGLGTIVAPDSVEPGGGYASVRRVFRIVDTVSRDGSTLTAKHLAHELGTSLSTCYQLINILREEGYIERVPHNGGYRLGPAIEVLHDRERLHGVPGLVAPAIRDLARRSGRQACLAVLSAGEVCVVQVENPSPSPPVGIAPGLRGAAHALAVGKVLIAFTGLKGISDYIASHRLDAFTVNTITEPVALEAHLKRIRATKVATSLEEFADNLFDVAVPLETDDGWVQGAIGVFTTARRSSSEAGPMIELARRAAERAAQLLAP